MVILEVRSVWSYERSRHHHNKSTIQFIYHISPVDCRGEKVPIVGKQFDCDKVNVFPEIKAEELAGSESPKEFITPYRVENSLVMTIWLTNLENGRVNPRICLQRKYKGFEAEFPKYDNVRLLK